MSFNKEFELYPSSSPIIDLRQKITPTTFCSNGGALSRTKLIFDELQRNAGGDCVNSSSLNASLLDRSIGSATSSSGHGYQPQFFETERWFSPRVDRHPSSSKGMEDTKVLSTTPSKQQQGPPRMSIFTPSRFAEIAARQSREARKPYWRCTLPSSSSSSFEHRVGPVPRSSLISSHLSPNGVGGGSCNGGASSRTERIILDALKQSQESNQQLVKQLDKAAATSESRAIRVPTVVPKQMKSFNSDKRKQREREVAAGFKANVFSVDDQDLLLDENEDKEEEERAELEQVRVPVFEHFPKVGFLFPQHQQQNGELAANENTSSSNVFTFQPPVQRGPQKHKLMDNVSAIAGKEISTQTDENTQAPPPLKKRVEELEAELTKFRQMNTLTSTNDVNGEVPITTKKQSTTPPPLIFFPLSDTGTSATTATLTRAEVSPFTFDVQQVQAPPTAQEAPLPTTATITPLLFGQQQQATTTTVTGLGAVKENGAATAAPLALNLFKFNATSQSPSSAAPLALNLFKFNATSQSPSSTVAGNGNGSMQENGIDSGLGHIAPQPLFGTGIGSTAPKPFTFVGTGAQQQQLSFQNPFIFGSGSATTQPQPDSTTTAGTGGTTSSSMLNIFAQPDQQIGSGGGIASGLGGGSGAQRKILKAKFTKQRR